MMGAETENLDTSALTPPTNQFLDDSNLDDGRHSLEYILNTISLGNSSFCLIVDGGLYLSYCGISPILCY